jgi:hypothetical protein
MIVRLVGLAFRVLARLRPGEAGLALERVGLELERLARVPAQRAAASR